MDAEPLPTDAPSMTRSLEPFPELEGFRGGMSLKPDGPMSWNGSDPAEIVQNRLRYFKKAGLDGQSAVAAEQSHGNRVHRATGADAGKGILDRESRIAGTDALVTNERGLILTTLHADCAPVYFADPDHHAIGLAHAGRRGALSGVGGNTLRRMAAEFGTNPREVRMALGPTICTRCYAVDPDVAAQFAARFGNQVIQWERDKPEIDLAAAIIMDLLEAGLNPSFIPPRPPCTATNAVFASYRRDGMPVRSMISWLYVP